MRALSRTVSLGLTILLILSTVVLNVGAAPALGQAEPAHDVQISSPFKAVVSHSTRNDTSPPLRSIPPKLPAGRKPIEIPGFPLPKAERPEGDRRPTGSAGHILQDRPGIAQMPSPLLNFDGLDNDDNSSVVGFRIIPPDTQGDVGPSHYVQWINLVWGVWDKDGSLLYGPAAGNTIWTGFGGPCEYTNDGDPITLYDQAADRWLMSQFALPNFPSGPYYECIAISATGDPLGAWHRYEFLASTTKMNDYPKLGVWPDAYYMTANQYTGGSSWGGAGVWALERDQMLQGNPTAMVYFDLYSVNPGFGGILPADWDGISPPPAGAPGLFVEWDDAAWMGDPTDTLRMWEFHVDWDDPGSSTFGIGGLPNATIATADVDPNVCYPSTRDCIPQPGTSQRLDAIDDRLMHRLQYRNFGSHEALVSNHTVDAIGIASGTGVAGLHWFEMRDAGSGWAMYQEGVYSPDSDHRWMGSIAMDRRGNIALGYSVSSSSTYPSARYAGRLAGDPLGLLSQAEVELAAGTSYQNGGNRWGDYSMMSVDPVDDCTFWTTQEYVASPATDWGNWDTRIGSFQYPGCLGPAGTLEGVVEAAGSGSPIVGAQVSAAADQTFVAYSQPPDGAYSFPFLPTGTYTVTAEAYGYLPQTATSVDILSGTTTIQDFGLVPAPMHIVEGHVTDATTGWPLYASINIDGYPGDPIWTNPETGYYSIALVAGTPYRIHVEAWVPGYLPATRDVGPLTGNTTEDFGLDADPQTCDAPGYAFLPSGDLFSDGFESGYDNWGMSGLWNSENETDSCGSLVAPFPSSSNDSYYGVDGTCTYNTGAPNSGELVLSSTVSIPSTVLPILSFWSYEATECGGGNCGYDERFVDVSTDDGGSWTPIWGSSGPENTWYEASADLSAYTGSSILIRFRFGTYDSAANDFFGWMVDNVAIAALECAPTPGGLVVGNVYDSNTLAPMTGAQVASDSGQMTTAMATPLDPAVDDAFYTLFSPTGSHVFSATMTSYLPDVQIRTVIPGATIGQDFYLPAGWLSYDPISMETILEMGNSTTLPLTLINNGGAPAAFEFVELDEGMDPVGPFEEPLFGVKPFKQNFPTSERAGVPEPPAAAPYAAGDVIQSWPAVSPSPWGIAPTPDDTVWVGEGWGDDRIYEYLSDGTPTGLSYAYPWSPLYGPADDALNWNSGMVWTMDVGGDNCIHEMDPVSGYTGVTICPGFATSQRGLAYDPTTDTYFAGSWNDLMIHHFAADGTMLDEVNVGLAISGLAYNPDTQHLFAMVNASPNPVYVLDAADNYSILGQFNVGAGFGSYAGSGFEFDCEGTLWAVDQSTNTVYQFESGEPTSMCRRDVPWLWEDPISGVVPAMTDMTIAINFDAAQVDTPGIYYAQLKIDDDTPYESPNMPITLTVTPPPPWGKLNGTVAGLGYCDEDPAPLAGAEVLVESWMTETITVPLTVMYEDFELSDGGYTITGTTSWAWGVPTSGPGAAHSGTNLWATNLSGSYGNYEDGYLTSPNIDLSAYAGQSATLSWWQWYQGENCCDYISLEISNDGGGSWTRVYGEFHGGNVTEDVWQQQEITLDPAYSVGNFRLRFRFRSDGSVTYPGWYVDDVLISAPGQVDVPVSWPLETDENGYYQVWMDETYSPLTVTVSYPEHESGQATGVTVSGQATTTVDFDLRWLQPCVSVEPDSLTVNLELGLSTVRSLELTNTGAAPADYDLTEADRGFEPILLPTIQVPGYQAPEGADATYAGQHLAYRESWLYQPPEETLLGSTPVDVLLVAATDATQIQAMLQAYPDINLVDYFDARVSTPTLAQLLSYDTAILISNSAFADPVAMGNVLADYVDAGGTVVQTVPTFYGSGWGLAGRFVNEGYSPFIGIGDRFSWADLGPYDISHRIMQGVTTASDYLRQMVDLDPGAAWVADWTDDEFVATKGPVVALNTFLADGYNWTGDVDLIVHNSILWLQAGGDVPWLREDPISGTLPADTGYQVVDITFDASVPEVDQPGDYYATLNVNSNDPVSSTIGVPVSMTVTAPSTWGKLNGTVTGLGYCDENPAPLAGAEVLVESWMTETITTPLTVMYEDFELSDGGYTVSGTTSWAWGVPTSGPGAAHSGTNLWATNLSGSYGNYEDGYLTSPNIDLSAYAGQSPTLSWWQWYQGENCCDYISLEISNDGGGSWTRVYGEFHGGNVTEDVWQQQEITLDPAYSVGNFRLRFRFRSDGSVTYPGWYVDDVLISAPGQVDVPVSWPLETDENGYYQVWMDEAYSPLTVTVAYPEHEAGQATGVTVSGQATTTVVFDLRSLEPCVSVEPASMEVTVLRGTSEMLPLTLYNRGAASTPFRMTEREGTVWPPELGPISGQGEWLYRSEEGLQLPANRGGEALAYPSAYRWQPEQPSESDKILIYADDYVHAEPNTFLDQALQALGLAYAAHYDSDWSGFEDSLTNGGPWDLVLVGNDSWLPPSSVWTALNSYVNGGGRLIYHGWTVGQDPGNALWATLGFNWISNDSDPPDPVYWWDPGHPIFTSPESVPEFTSLSGGIYGVYGQHVEPLEGFEALAGYTTPGPDLNQAALILGNDGRTMFKAFLDGQNSVDLDTDTLPDGVELWINLIAGIRTGFGGDVLWLDEYPDTGTIDADSFFDVDVTFTAFPTMTAGVYTATIVANTRDAINPAIDIPVTMTVVHAPVCSFGTSSPDELGETTIFTNTTSEGYTPTTYRWDFGDDSPTSTAEHATHDYAHVGLYTVVLTATNQWGENVCSDTVSIEGVEGGFISNSPVTLGEPAIFTNTTLSNPPIVQWFWTFGDGHSSQEENPIHTYADPGVYTVTLFAANVPYYGPQSVYDIYQDTVEVVPASPYGVRLAPTTAQAPGVSAVPVYYTLQVDNTGSVADTFDVTVSGESWTTIAPPTVGPLAVGGSTNLVVTVTIPAKALLGESDTANVTVASQGEPAVSASATLTTTSNNIYGVMVIPSADGKYGEPGTTVEYTLLVSNTGNTVDTLCFTHDGNTWDVHLSTPCVTLAASRATDVNVTVDIPSSAGIGNTDTVTVTATSKSDPTKSDSAVLTTEASEVVYIHLPIVLRNYGP